MVDFLVEDHMFNWLKRERTYRFTITFSDEAAARMNELQAHTPGATSWGEVVRQAIRTWAWYREMRKQGYKIGLVRDKQFVRVATELE